MKENDSRTLTIDALNERREQVVSCLKKGMKQKALLNERDHYRQDQETV